MFGAKINAKDEKGNTPLHYAVHGASLSIAELLLQSGADRSIKNREGRTPMDLMPENAAHIKYFLQVFQPFKMSNVDVLKYMEQVTRSPSS